jgi:uncharacterized protein (DUF1800 family)
LITKGHAFNLTTMNSKRHLLQLGLFGASLAVLKQTSAQVSAGSAQAQPKNVSAAAHALNRFGYGPRPEDLASVKQDPRGWAQSQLQPAALPMALGARLTEIAAAPGTSIENMRELAQMIRQNRAAGDGSAKAQAMPTTMVDGAASTPEQVIGETPAKYARTINRAALTTRLLRALESPNQLEEVMVDFWFNHFNVFQGKNLLRVAMGQYESEAIRPFALGRFRDLLGATAHHPAMMYYLDNFQSVQARPGRARGLNENYARELMELHTLGVDGGYNQQDVTELARMLTGWSIQPFVRVMNNRDTRHDTPQGFRFNSAEHDNGSKLWLGHKVVGADKAEGDFALDVLAKHPATAKNIAFKLAQYFVSDSPSPTLVQKLAAVFTESDGQIVPVLTGLINSNEFWDPAGYNSKFKTPYHYTLSVLRARAATVQNFDGLINQLANQGQPLYGCPTPDGYKNTERAWLNPDAMTKRINFATQIGRGKIGSESINVTEKIGSESIIDWVNSLGPLVNEQTAQAALKNKADPALAVALVLAGPNMMRR